MKTEERSTETVTDDGVAVAADGVDVVADADGVVVVVVREDMTRIDTMNGHTGLVESAEEHRMTLQVLTGIDGYDQEGGGCLCSQKASPMQKKDRAAVVVNAWMEECDADPAVSDTERDVTVTGGEGTET